MKKLIYGCILAVSCGMLFYFSPDPASMAFIGIMILLVGAGYLIGILRINEYSEGFLCFLGKIEEMKKVAVSDRWVYIKQIDSLFHNAFLDRLFQKYVKKVEGVKLEKKAVLPDVEDSINEDHLSLHCMKNFIDVIPGTLTGLGLLGTFYGLLGGIGGIRFSSVDVVVDSISSLVHGIDTAFYTSIAGVTLSLLFEIITKLSWNNMLGTMMEFYDEFHAKVIPDEQSQREDIQLRFYDKVLVYMERHANEENQN